MPSSLKDSRKGVSERRIRDGRLDKLGLLIPPLMAELQLEADDDFIVDEMYGSCEFLASWFSSSGLQLMMPHSSFCLLDVSSDDIGLA
mmetsp:Transcript_16150/g.26512  ORF Transcript_16150/g.26512 Transcript_16150/m.26512 type:complete len:88 (-) Transcript_16150:627-890(-)